MATIKSIEEKAKAYDEAINTTRNLVKACLIYEDAAIQVFPDFKKEESEDERIRKAILNHLTKMWGNSQDDVCGVHVEDAIAWLEKQGEHANFRNKIQIGDKVTRNEDGVLVNLSQLNRVAKKGEKQGEQNPVEPQQDMLSQEQYAKAVDECVYGEQKPNPCDGCVNRKGCINCENGELREVEQKPADKVEIGDLITNGILVGKIDEIHEWGYHAYFGDHYADVPDVENWHKWTIKDAKGGSVLSYNDGHGNDSIELIKSITDKKIEFWFCLTNGNRYEVFDGITPYTNLVSREDATPATKEQREQLEKAITEAGYEWDAEKKELRKIVAPIFRIGDRVRYKGHACDGVITEITDTDYICGDAKLPISTQDKLELVEQKPAWSEEDEKQARQIERIVHDDGCTQKLQKQIADWLKSLKDRVQPKQEWSKEDEAMRIKTLHHLSTRCSVQEYEEIEDWLKSLHPQKQWKPSDEQIRALNYVVNLMASSERPTENDLYYNILKSLREQLKKLREEDV